jgi:hypothetical protein
MHVSNQEIADSLKKMHACAFALSTFSAHSQQLLNAMLWSEKHFKKMADWLEKQPDTSGVTEMRQMVNLILLEEARLFEQMLFMNKELMQLHKKPEPKSSKSWLLRLFKQSKD